MSPRYSNGLIPVHEDFSAHWPRHVRSAVVHAVSMANAAFTATTAHAANHFNARISHQAENDRLEHEVALLLEELRIKDARMERLSAQRRPHYPPIERLAILELRAARGWSQAQTARRLLVTPLTVATWTNRLDDEGPDALVQVREPVSRFPDFVSYLVQRPHRLCRKFGRRPGHLITDHGPQFTADTFIAWCRRHGIQPRFGAIGKYGSLAVIERFIRSLKNECTRLLPVVPDDYVAWYNAERPHSRFGARTPDEIYFNRFPACRRPRRSPCAQPHALVRGRPGAVVELVVEHRGGRKHLQAVSLRRVA